MAAAMDVARQFVRLAWEDEEPEGLTHLRLQKLLYYAQGWHLAAFGLALFAGHIEAWNTAPLSKQVYPAFAGKTQPIRRKRPAIRPGRTGPGVCADDLGRV